MEYISVKETADKWGIHPTRVTLLARNGRIHGAMQMGHEWLIPKDADKPQDARRNSGKKETVSPVYFPFFLYLFRGKAEDRAALIPEYQKLYDAQLLYVHGKIKESAEMLNELIATSQDRYIKIGAIVTRGFTCIELGQALQYDKCIHSLDYLFVDDFPYKTDLIYTYYDLQSYGKGTEKWAANFQLDADYHFHVETGPYLVTNLAYSALINLAVNSKPVDTSLLELYCVGLEDRGYFFTVQMVRSFLAGMYYLLGKEEQCKSTLRKVMDVAISEDSYYPMVLTSRFLTQIFDELLHEYPTEAAEKVRKRSKSFYDGLSVIRKYYSGFDERPSLTKRDYEFIMYAFQGKKNSEVAKLNGISQPTVSKYYSDIYSKIGVRNKKELIEYLRYTVIINRL